MKRARNFSAGPAILPESVLEKVQSEIRIQTKENTEILRALKYNSEEHKALIDKSNMSISYIQGDVTAIKNSVDTTNVKLKILEAEA